MSAGAPDDTSHLVTDARHHRRAPHRRARPHGRQRRLRRLRELPLLLLTHPRCAISPAHCSQFSAAPGRKLKFSPAPHEGDNNPSRRPLHSKQSVGKWMFQLAKWKSFVLGDEKSVFRGRAGASWSSCQIYAFCRQINNQILQMIWSTRNISQELKAFCSFLLCIVIYF